LTVAVWVSMHPVTYWSLGALVWLALIAFSALCAPGSSRMGDRRNQFVFAGLSIAAFMVNRWPILFDPATLNADEAQMAAQAIKSLSDPLPWHGFDGTTSGPLNSYILALPRVFGRPITMPSTHVIAAGLELGTIFALQSAAAKVFGAPIGRAAALMLFAFFGFAQNTNDFVDYSSEHLPIFLIVCGLCALADVYAKSRPNLASCALGGIALGLAPFAKLQSTLLAVSVGTGIVLVLLRRSAPPATKGRRFASFLAGALGSVALLVALTGLGGSIHDAVVSYVLSNAAYSQRLALLGPRFFISTDPMYATFVLGSISLFVLLGSAAIWSPANPYYQRIAAFAGGLTLVGIWTVRLANHAFAHYLSFAIVPSVVLVAALAGIVYRDWRSRIRRIWPGRRKGGLIARAMLFASVAATMIVPSLLQQLVLGNSFAHDGPAYFGYRDRMGAALRHIIPVNSRVAVWGWMPQFYVSTQTVMATKDAHTYAEIVPGPYRDYFRARYMNEMLSRPPAYFVDAVAPGSFAFTDRAAYGMETFPQLAAFIARDYRLVAELNGVRVYCRKAS